MRYLWFLLLLPLSVVAQTLLLKASKQPPKPFIELLAAGALESCLSSGTQPPVPCNPETGRAQLNNASYSITVYQLDGFYSVRRVTANTDAQLGGTCSLSMRLGSLLILSGLQSEWSGTHTTDRITIHDPTGSRCLIVSLQVWAEQ